MKKIVFLTGAGMSVESGFKTFRGNDGLWENYPVEQVASHEGWEANPTLVTNFYNLHEKAGSSHVIHLHGELTKVCSSDDPYNPEYIQTMTEEHSDVEPGTKAGDGSLLRPFIVFFGESVPMIEPAIEEAQKADIFVVIGTSLNVYPAAGLVQYTRRGTPIYLIDPNPVTTDGRLCIKQIQKGASEGMRDLVSILSE